MERIGIAASRMSKGNLAWYNFYVVLFALLFSVFVFLIAGSVVVFSLMIIRYIGTEVMAVDLLQNLKAIIMVCMFGLSIVMGVFLLIAIIKNLKLKL